VGKRDDQAHGERDRGPPPPPLLTSLESCLSSVQEEKSVSRPNPLAKEAAAGRASQADLDLLLKMTPLEGASSSSPRSSSPCTGSVTWSTWGSKLESIFTPIFATLPALQVLPSPASALSSASTLPAGHPCLHAHQLPSRGPSREGYRSREEEEEARVHGLRRHRSAPSLPPLCLTLR
jgi:hypothetical protein